MYHEGDTVIECLNRFNDLINRVETGNEFYKNIKDVECFPIDFAKSILIDFGDTYAREIGEIILAHTNNR